MKTRHGIGMWAIACTAAALTAGCASSGSSYDVERTTVNGLPSVASAEKDWTTVNIDAVDYATRMIAISDEKGVSYIYRLSPDVRNLYQLRKGRTVRVELAKFLSANVYKINEAPSVEEAAWTERATPGETPEMTAYRTVRSTMNVEEINHQTRQVTLKGADGNLVTIAASPKLKKLERVQKGDHVVFRYTERLKIEVNKT